MPLRPVSRTDAPQNVGILNVLDDVGRVQAQLRGPARNGHRICGRQPGRFAAGSVLECPQKWIFTVYDAESGKPGATSVHDIGNTWALVFSPDGTRLATGGEDGVTRLWDTSTGAMTALCRGHTRKVFSVAFQTGWSALCDEPRRMGPYASGIPRRARRLSRPTIVTPGKS